MPITAREVISAMLRRSPLSLLVVISALVVLGAAILLEPRPIAAADLDDKEMATKLANLLRAGRSVVSANQPLINDPAVGEKSFTGDKLVAEAEAIYAERTGTPLAPEGVSERDKRLIAAQKEAMQRIVDQHQADINKEGVGFKGFIPAVFARLVNEEFESIAGGEARVRVTAPMNLVRNRKARPDAWELEVLETRLLADDWPEGQYYTERVEFEGRPAFRMLFPEYYRASCLSCHGEPRGELDITGYPKEGGKEGDLGGAISIVIFE